MAYRASCAKIIAEPLRLTPKMDFLHHFFCTFSSQQTKTRTTTVVRCLLTRYECAAISIACLICVSYLLHIIPSFSTFSFCFCSPPFRISFRQSAAMLRPQRISSEAPEVVPQQHEPDLYLANTTSHLDKFKRKKGTQYEKQLAEHQRPGLDERTPPMAFNGGGYGTPASVSSPRATEREYQTPGPSYDLSSHKIPPALEDRHDGRKVCGLITTIVLVIVAFMVGGGVGGGIGGAIAVQHRSR